ncbi:MAG: hypothetical protein IH899_01645 [Planctomycetes bacterium]|nr:hypothetical protein [Planctomycetota bacterium]
MRAAIHTVADKYGGTVHDRGNINGLDVEFEIDRLQMFAGTFVSHRRKYINYHAFEIRTLPPDGSKSQRQVLSLVEAQSAEFFYQQSPPSLPVHDSSRRTPKLHCSRKMKYEENEVLRVVF